MSKTAKSIIYLSIPLLAIFFMLPGCRKKDVYPSQQLPQITSLSPGSAIAGTQVTIKGMNLKTVDEVKFGTTDAKNFDASANTDTSISVVVPDSLPLGPLYLQVYLPDGKGYAAASFTVLLTPPVPKIDSISPITALPGTQVTIWGNNFALVTNVKFGGVDASFAHTLDTNGKLTTIVPMNAIGGDQFLTVINPNGMDSIAFNVNLEPVITSFSPTSGQVGDSITVSGQRFTNITSVQLNSTDAGFTVWNDSTLKFAVPVGAQNGYITVTNALGTATSPQSFVVVVPIQFYIYQDALYGNWQISSYSANTSDNTSNPESGTNCLYTAYTGGYGAFRISDYSGTTNIDLTSYSTLRFSIYGGPGTDGQKISVAVNNNYSNTVIVNITEGKYTDYFIPLSSLGSPTSLNEVVLQEFSGNAATTIYVDNIGLN